MSGFSEKSDELAFKIVAYLIKNAGHVFSISQLVSAFGYPINDTNERKMQRVMKKICDYQDRDSAASLAIIRTRFAAGYGYSIAKSAQLYKAFQKSRPETVLQLLKQRMPLAQRAEPELFNVTLSSLLDRIYVAPDTILLPAPEQEDVVNNVYQAVASQQYMQLSYIDSRRQQQQLCFLPWGLMFKGLTTYLVGKKRNSKVRGQIQLLNIFAKSGVRSNC